MKGRSCRYCGTLCLPSGFKGAWQHYRGGNGCWENDGSFHRDPAKLMPEGILFVKGEEDAFVVELADTQDLGSCAERCGGSSPSGRTNLEKG